MTDKGCNGDTMGGPLKGMGWRETLGGYTTVLFRDLGDLGDLVSFFTVKRDDRFPPVGGVLLDGNRGGVHTAVHFFTASQLARFSTNWLVLAPFSNFD